MNICSSIVDLASVPEKRKESKKVFVSDESDISESQTEMPPKRKTIRKVAKGNTEKVWI